MEAKAMRPIKLALVEPADREQTHWRKALQFGSRYPEALQLLPAEGESCPDADLVLLLITSYSDSRSRSFHFSGGFPRNKQLAVLAGNAAKSAPEIRRAVVRTLDLPPERIIEVADLADFSSKLPVSLFNLHHELVIPLARQFPIFRQQLAWEEIHATAQQNALVGLIPVPGGDMPLMTANQIKLVWRLAVMFDLPINARRLQEILAVIGSGFGWRILFRQLTKLVPGPGWLIGGGLGYAGTMALGKAALEYFGRIAGQK
ncbi:MAG: hypothetical protein HY692_02155 [Cyanobacteria bacterium NC_groundwater_1444_Ag_S-0.65um_54_12]|nr:hypothetical protein [Cyanobacteria bacterium NC_groundwater_1444_Ag_S-0.65um_54_12]